ncbi:membrane protein FxsA [Iodidimonas gelatinilytica]|uniref:Membrane protein FxsA n=1 Tax=Iodidimonas gelatinilytica TaxID=1236966 RepID=A0A5A7N0Q3_9PROT|nr:FxsA family protein [Iodidimonas gelatinilytica]GER01607.1 membrane protein FxsA [Iodidimonas gelatinilytica]
MALLFLLSLILTPLVEISIFISVGEDIGAFPVLILILATAAIGVAIVRAQGVETIRRARAELGANRAPVMELMHGAMLALAGLLLLIPGFLTDFLGALLLIPPLRTWIAFRIFRHSRPGSAHVVIEGEFWEQSDTHKPEDGGPYGIDRLDDDPAGPDDRPR